MDKFNQVYNKIIQEMNEERKGNVVSEGIFRKMGGMFRTAKGKNKMMKTAIISWMNANNFTENGAENKFIGKLSNDFTLKFTFRPSQWNDPEAKEIDYAVYLKDPDGKSKTIDKNGTIDYGYSESDIKKELSNKLKLAMPKEDAKGVFKTKKDVDKQIRSDRKAEADAKAAEEAKAAAEAKRAQDKVDMAE